VGAFVRARPCYLACVPACAVLHGSLLFELSSLMTASLK